MMSSEMRLSRGTGECLGTRRSVVGTFLAGLRAHVAASVKVCADYYQAAAMYEQLSKLGEAELRRRGLSRATLALDLCAACSRER